MPTSRSASKTASRPCNTVAVYEKQTGLRFASLIQPARAAQVVHKT